MADIAKAVVGTPITAKAANALRERLRVNHNFEIPLEVQDKTDQKDGQWFCIDCGYVAQHNLDAWNHAEKHTAKRPHRFAWLTHGVDGAIRIEEP